MRNLISVLLWTALFIPTTAHARSLEWNDLASSGQLEAGKIVDGWLHVDNPDGKPKKIVLWTLDEPNLKEPKWSLHGEVRYQDVAGDAYLELDNVLPEGTFFSRTLADAGPSQKLSGTSSGRRFVIPFDARDGSPPERIVFSLFLPGPGSVEIGPLELVDGNFGRGDSAWVDERMSGVVFGTLGALLGCLAGLLGVLASRGTARPIVMGLLAVLLAGCAVAMAAGVVAVVLGQPWFVAAPALGIGALGLAVLTGVRRTILIRFQELELRRMQAMDAR